jgi:zinc protease
LTPYFSQGLRLLADNELHPALPEAAFAIVKQQNSDLAAGELKSPSYRVQRALDHALLPARDPMLRQTTPATLADVSLSDVKDYYAKTFRPDLTTIVIVGNISPEEAKSEVEACFGTWKAAGPKPDVTLPRVPPNPAASTYVPDNTQVQDSVTLAEELQLTRFNPDYYALQVGNHVLGGGFYATRLYHDLRQVTGYVYTVEDFISTTKTRTMYAVVYASAPDNVSKAADLVKRDLTDMQRQNVSPAELQQAKALLLREIPLDESSENAITGALLNRAQLGLPLDEPLRAAEHYIDMTADTVREAFAKWVRVQDLAQVVRGPAPK